ncbi:MAG: LytTR family DNA-binding domain-containing protein [Oscillospiraceae bacterium]|nr:LytTR family DNA-binding domain-containing protein [Oscillospiraceae bacterium]
MLQAVIYDSNAKQRKHTETIVKNHILIHDLRIELAVPTDCSTDILAHLKDNQNKSGLYFLRLEQHDKTTVLELAKQIREHQPSAFIVFLATQAKYAHLCFFHKIAAMDYIILGTSSADQRMGECIDTAYARYLADKAPHRGGYQIKSNGQTRVIPFDEILYFESHHIPHKMILHTEDSSIEFYGPISKVEENCPGFYRCHKSFVINTRHVRTIDSPAREATLKNGAKVLVSVRRLTRLLETLKSP